jgi:MFS family permease
VLWLPDPPRGVQEGGAAPAPKKLRGNAVLSALKVYLNLLTRGPYMLLVLGYAAYTFGLGALGVWMPSFLERVRGIPVQTATTGFGIIVVVTGILGTFIGGWLGDYCLKRSRQGYLWFCGVVTLAAAPFAVVALTASAPHIFYPAVVISELLLFMSTGPINAAIANVVSPLERASAIALSMFAIHLLGDVPSPPLIGYLADVGSLQRGVLLVPVAIVIGGIIWVASAVIGSHRTRVSPA